MRVNRFLLYFILFGDDDEWVVAVWFDQVNISECPHMLIVEDTARKITANWIA